MTKTEALKIFGDTQPEAVKQLASALSISRQAIYQWPEELPQETVDRVVGAAVRLKKWPGSNRGRAA